MSQFDDLIQSAKTEAGAPRFLFATVNSTNPLSITIDGDDDPLEIVPSTTVDGILPGDKVACTLQSDELIVTGVVDGDIDYVEEFSAGIATAQDAAETADTKATTASVAAAQASSDAAQATADAAQAAADAAAAAAGIAQAAADAHSALTAANGKNRVFYPPNSPSGDLAAGDIWFKDSSDTVEMHIYDGTDWVLGVVSDLNIPGINVNKLTGDTITGNFIIAGSLNTAASGARVENDKTGIRVYDGDEVLQTSFGTDGTSTFKGQIEASGIEVSKTGQLKLNSTTNEIGSGAALTIAGGVTAPSIAPVVTPYWNSLQLKDSTGAPLTGVKGVTQDSATGEWIVAVLKSDAIAVTRHNATTGAYVNTVGTVKKASGSDKYTYWNGTTGVGYLNGVAWVFRSTEEMYNAGTSIYPVYLWREDLELVSTAGTVKTLVSNAPSGSVTIIAGRGGIGPGTATQLALLYWDAGVSEWVQTLYNPTTGAKASTSNVGGSSIAYGTFDFGAPRFVTAQGGQIVSRTAAGVAVDAEAFGNASTQATVGLGYSSGFWSAHTDGQVYFYDGPAASLAIGYVWRDSKLAGTGYHESPLSPMRTTTVAARRARLRITTATLAATPGDDGVDSIRLYGGSPGGPYYHQAAGTANQYDLVTLATSGATSGSVAAFPGSSPGAIRNATGDIFLPGVGIAKLKGINIPIRLAAVDLNTVTIQGTYVPTSAAEATLTLNYPVAAVGVLEVFSNGISLIQRYTTLAASPQVFVRGYTSASWGSWAVVGAPTYPRARASTTSNISLKSGHTRLAMAEEYDTHSAYDPSTGLFVTPEAGLYDIRACLCFASVSARRFIAFEQGTAAVGSNTPLARVEGPATANSSLNLAVEVQLDAGVSIGVDVYAASATSTSGTYAPTSFSIRRVA